MNYPLIYEYIEAIKSAEDNFEELSCLRPVLDDDGLPVMTSCPNATRQEKDAEIRQKEFLMNMLKEQMRL